MRILVCIKRVPAPGARIVLTADEQAIDASHLGFAMSPHEECAVEEAVRLAEASGGTSTVLTLGAPDSEEQLRYAASLGVTEAVLVPTDGTDWEPIATAIGLTSAIEMLETENGPFDLILFGNESADSGGFQVGVRVAYALGRPVVSGIKGIELDGDDVVARRDTDSGSELYRLPRPAVLAVKEGLNLPRYPTLKGRLSAKKVVITEHQAELEPAGQTKIRLMSPPHVETSTEMLGTDASAAGAVVDLLEELGVL